MGARADGLNRVLLALLGLVLLVAGVAGLLVGLGALGEDLSDDLVVAGEVEEFVVDESPWLWPLAALLLVALALLALRWLAQQLRTDRVDQLDLTEDRARGETHVAAAAVTDALVDAVERCPGVEHADARVVRLAGRRQLLLTVRLADRADVPGVRRALADGPLTDLRQALGNEPWPHVQVRLEPSTRGRARTVA